MILQLPPCFGLQSSSTSERGAIRSATGCELRESLPESREVDRKEGEGRVPATPSPEMTTSASEQISTLGSYKQRQLAASVSATALNAPAAAADCGRAAWGAHAASETEARPTVSKPMSP